MRAAVLREHNSELVVEDLDVARPGRRDVLVRTVAAGVCHSDLHAVRGELGVPLPIVLGHEAAGIVEAVGADVTQIRPGDHVVTCLSAACGGCRYCAQGRPNLCSAGILSRPSDSPALRTVEGDTVHLLGLGSFAEQMLVDERAVVVIDADVPLDLAALFGCGVLTGLGAVLRTAGVRPGESVVVVGCGGVGLTCIQGAVIAAASQVIAVDLHDWKLDLAAQMGATACINSSGADPVEAVRDLTGGGADHVFEVVGSAGTFAQATMMSRPAGTTTVVGLLADPDGVTLPHGALSMERRVQGCTLGSNRFRFDIPTYLAMHREGRFHVEPMVSARIGLNDINHAFAAMERGEVARSVVVFGPTTGDVVDEVSHV